MNIGQIAASFSVGGAITNVAAFTARWCFSREESELDKGRNEAIKAAEAKKPFLPTYR